MVPLPLWELMTVQGLAATSTGYHLFPLLAGPALPDWVKRVMLWCTAVCVFSWKWRSLHHLQEKRYARVEHNRLRKFYIPKSSEEPEASRFSETLSQRYSSYVTGPHISPVRALVGIPDSSRLNIQPPLELSYNYVLDLTLSFFCNTLAKNKRTLLTTKVTFWLLYIEFIWWLIISYFKFPFISLIYQLPSLAAIQFHNSYFPWASDVSEILHLLVYLLSSVPHPSLSQMKVLTIAHLHGTRG